MVMIKLQAMEERFVQQRDIPKTMSDMVTKPSQHHETPFCLIVTTNKFEEDATNGIYEYNLETNQMNMLHEYRFWDLPMTPGHEYYHTQILNSEKDTLYYIGPNLFANPMTFNLKTKAATYDVKLPRNKWDIIPTTAYIPSPINECHIFDAMANHFKYDVDEARNTATVDRMETNMASIQPNTGSYSKPFYVSFTKQLMIMGFSKDDQIFVCDIVQDNKQQSYEWKLYPLKMPHLVSNLDYYDVLVVQHLVFVFYFPEGNYSDIWCLDLGRNEWYQSPHQISDQFCNFGNTFAFKDRLSYVHIIDFYTGNHDKIYLHHLIPNELKQMHWKQYELIVAGYINEKVKNKIIPAIALVLKDLICRYVPLVL
eukprot:213051_1